MPLFTGRAEFIREIIKRAELAVANRWENKKSGNLRNSMWALDVKGRRLLNLDIRRGMKCTKWAPRGVASWRREKQKKRKWTRARDRLLRRAVGETNIAVIKAPDAAGGARNDPDHRARPIQSAACGTTGRGSSGRWETVPRVREGGTLVKDGTVVNRGTG